MQPTQYSSLGLDEALVTVNRTAVQETLDVYYQIDECFGCPLEKLKSLAAKIDDFVIGTKFGLQLELRGSETGRSVCKLDGLTLNNHGHYMIDVGPSAKNPAAHSGSNGSAEGVGLPFDCSLQTITNGDCHWCPLAIILCLLFVVTVGEQLYTRLVTSKSTKRQRVDQKSTVATAAAPTSGQTQATSREQQQQQQDAAENGSDAPLASENTMPATGDQAEMGEMRPCDEDALPGPHSVSDEADHCQQLKTAAQPAAGSSRVDSLDAFRGLTIAGMILVNYGGAGYVALEHKPWDGITPADLVFPFFIFSMGASIAISTRSMVRRGKSICELFARILRRSLILMAVGLCLNSRALDGRSLNHLRLTGVLQRFSISYFVVALMFSLELTTDKWIKAQSLSRIRPCLSNLVGTLVELLTASNCLAIYIYLTFYFEYSSTCPAGYTGPGGQTEGGRYANCTGGAAAWLDRLVLGEQHLYNDATVKSIFKTQRTHDPEGILGYTTSILLTLVGLQCGKILAQFRSHKTRLLMLSQWIGALAVACCSVILIPINKRLWSLTFVALSGLVAYLIITLLYLLMDVYRYQRTFLLRLLVSAGKNALLLYVGHSLLDGMLPWYFAVQDDSSHLQLLMRLAWATFVWLLLAHYLALKGLFVRV